MQLVPLGDNLTLIQILIFALGKYGIFLVVILPLFSKKREVDYLFAGSVAGIIGELVKHFFPSARPFITNGTTPLLGLVEGPSFPSNHTAISLAMALTVWRSDRKLGMVMMILALLVGASRVWGGVHLPIDFLGGAVLGAVVGGFFNIFDISLKAIYPKFRTGPPTTNKGAKS